MEDAKVLQCDGLMNRVGRGRLYSRELSRAVKSVQKHMVFNYLNRYKQNFTFRSCARALAGNVESIDLYNTGSRIQN